MKIESLDDHINSFGFTNFLFNTNYRIPADHTVVVETRERSGAYITLLSD
jgi:hypothetical protein